ncbi:hypothetical protein HanRHA438_Chr15g0729721 [Helianthus annuus]|nr:hypothetical protein HanRHA438_Chr15g0729721 [Helianthus annuus]
MISDFKKYTDLISFIGLLGCYETCYGVKCKYQVSEYKRGLISSVVLDTSLLHFYASSLCIVALY